MGESPCFMARDGDIDSRDDTPLVSAIVPTYNRAGLVVEAVESILRQDHARLELIVVDDGSTDDTRNALARFAGQITYLTQPNAGPAAARNRGVEASSGEIVAFLDSDDLWSETKLPYQLSYLAAHPEVDVVLGYTHVSRLSLAPDGTRRFTPDPKPKRVFHVGAALFRRSVFETIGLFDPSLRFWEDQDWFDRARERGVKMVCLTGVTQILRYHEDNMTYGLEKGQADLLRFLKNRRDSRSAAD